MSIICPTVLAAEPHEYREQMERVQNFARRIQIDLTDGNFTPNKTVGLEQVWWPEGIEADLHLMYKSPADVIDQAMDLKPSLVIVHAEADGAFIEIAEKLKKAGIKTGVALLKETDPERIKPALDYIDHVLIFSGDLGHFGGQADLSLLTKVKKLREWKPEVEIGWDGGVNADNALALVTGGVKVLNVGGYIQKADDPKEAYDTLIEIVENKND